jgi:hypothetical protein
MAGSAKARRVAGVGFCVGEGGMAASIGKSLAARKPGGQRLAEKR